jgi:hypothetical protein
MIGDLSGGVKLGFRIQDSGFRIQDSGFRIQDSEVRIQKSEVRIQNLSHPLERIQLLFISTLSL